MGLSHPKLQRAVSEGRSADEIRSMVLAKKLGALKRTSGARGPLAGGRPFASWSPHYYLRLGVLLPARPPDRGDLGRRQRF